MALMSAGAQAWAKGLEAWGKVLGGVTAAPAATTASARTAGSLRPSGARTRSLTRSARPICASRTRCSARSRRSMASTRHAREIAVRDAQLRRCDEPVELRADQSQVLKRTLETRGENSPQGPVEHAARHRAGAADADEVRRVRGRAQSRDDARQGDQADAALPADPVHADHRRGAEDAGRHLPAVDQPLLHPRPHAPRKASSNGAWTTASGCSWSAGNRRTRASPT